MDGVGREDGGEGVTLDWVGGDTGWGGKMAGRGVTLDGVGREDDGEEG